VSANVIQKKIINCSDDIQIFTAAEIIHGNFFPKLGKMLPSVFDLGNISSTSGKQFPIMTSSPVTIRILLTVALVH